MSLRDPIIDNDRANALVGWTLTGVVVLAAAHGVLSNQLLWSGLALSIVVTIVLPPLVTRSPTTIAPWPLVFVAAAAVTLQSVGYAPELSGYVTIAAFALLVVVELDVFTEVDMSRRFAVVFAVLVTLATEAVWTIAQFYSDRWLGTRFLQSQTELQWDLVAVTAVALVMGLAFAWYFERVGYGGHQNLPGEAESA